MGVDPLAALANFPRDGTIVVEQARDFAEALATRGYHVVLVGKPSERIPWVPDAQTLNDLWSRISCRNYQAACFGSQELCDLTKKMTERSQVNVLTSVYRARGWVTNMVRNLPRLLEPTAIGSITVSARGRVPAFIVGAGSSLDLNHHLLPECQKRGVVIAVNGACRLPGVDVALTVESNDLRHKLGPLDHVGIRAFGMIADPAVMAHGAGPLLPIYNGELARLLEPLVGEEKLACSAHGGTAAMSLAERWGCDPIVLIGHDFALGERVYPKCLGLGESKAIRDGDVVRYQWDETLRKQPRQNPLNELEPALELPGIAGGTVWSTMTLAGTRAWFQSAATGLGAGTRLWNASEWGAAIDGWQHATLADVLAELPEAGYEIRSGDGVAPDRLVAWAQGQIDGCEMVADACRRILEGATDSGLATLLFALKFAPLAEAWCLAETHELMAERRSVPMSRNPFTEYRAAGDAAGKLAAVVLAELPALVSELEKACSSIRQCHPVP